MCCADLTAVDQDAPCCRAKLVLPEPSLTAPVPIEVVREPTEQCANCGQLADLKLRCGCFYCYLCYDRGRDDCNPIVQAKRRVTVYAGEPDEWHWEWRWYPGPPE